jgi:hypothetical protein
MKAILEYNLPEDRQDFDFATQGSDWWNVCYAMNQWLRQQYKHMPDEEYSEDKYDTYVKCREKLLQLITENNLNIDQ